MPSPDREYKLKVHTQIMGKPKLRIGAWLIRLGAQLARVHVKVWIEEIKVVKK